MAVKRVFGKVDGKEVVYSHAEGNRWILPVPADEDGEYVIEVWAEDDAGNISFITKLLCTFDPHCLAVILIPIEWNSKMELSDIQALLVKMRKGECPRGIY